jgi:ferredoxin-NADP reductase
VSGGIQIDVRVSEVETVAEGTKRFRMVPVSGRPLPLFSAGSHIVVTMIDGGRAHRNPYSLMGSQTDSSSYQISVLRCDPSRGGSRFMHESVVPGSLLTISHPINLFPIDLRGRKHILVAGGIGITPLIAMAEQLSLSDSSFELHYCMRGRSRGAYVDALQAKYGKRVHVYCDDQGQFFPISLLDNQPLGTHLYVCGPQGLIELVLSAARAAGWPDENLHSEQFLAPPPGLPFAVRLARSNLSVDVGEHESILDAVEAAGVDARYLCRGGACGQCETSVLSMQGELIHNDHYLTPEERDSRRKLMICVSRFRGDELVLDL